STPRTTTSTTPTARSERPAHATGGSSSRSAPTRSSRRPGRRSGASTSSSARKTSGPAGSTPPGRSFAKEGLAERRSSPGLGELGGQRADVRRAEPAAPAEDLHAPVDPAPRVRNEGVGGEGLVELPVRRGPVADVRIDADD